MRHAHSLLIAAALAGVGASVAPTSAPSGPNTPGAQPTAASKSASVDRGTPDKPKSNPDKPATGIGGWRRYRGGSRFGLKTHLPMTVAASKRASAKRKNIARHKANSKGKR